MIFPETNGLLPERLAATKARSPFAVSMVVHGAACGFLFFGLQRMPRTVERPAAMRPTVRLLEAPVPDLEALRYSAPGEVVGRSAAEDTKPAAATYPTGAPSPAALSVKAQPAPQTLIQPDMPLQPAVIKPTPVPSMVLWSADAFPSRQLVLPQPQAQTAVVQRPSLSQPNREPRVAELKLSAAVEESVVPLPAPSTTAPLPSLAHVSDRNIAQTTAVSNQLPSGATVLSASDVPAHEGPIVVPPGNTSPHASTNLEASGPGLQGSAPAASNNASNAQTGAVAGRNGPDHNEGSKSGSGPAGTSARVTSGGEALQGKSDSGGNGSVIHISRPRNGQFGVVVLGASLADEYPDIVGVWRGRLTYSVYLPGSGGKNWILQYGVPVQDTASGRPEAPWPYEMVEPTLSPADDSTGAILVHGFVSSAGRFEQLAVVSSSDVAQAKPVLNALRQWQFRPSTQNGHPTTVEVLLIIPAADAE